MNRYHGIQAWVDSPLGPPVPAKGRVWEGTAAKDDALKTWCERVSAATGVGLLHDHPVWMIEADRTTRLQVVDAEPRAGLTLLGGAKGCEPNHVASLRVQELGT